MTMTAASSRYSARDLDQRITLQQPAGGQDALGNATDAWVTVGTVWARVQPLRGREFFAAGQMQAAAELRMVIRWRADVLTTWRVLWNGQAHEIMAPPADIDGQRHWPELMVASGVRAGL